MTVAPAWFFRASVIYALVAMALGIHMAASGDHGQLTTHAHINLVGWVTTFLYGAYLKLHPGSGGRLTAVLWWIANVAVVLMAVGLYLVFAGNAATGEPIATAASILIIIGMAIFAFIVFRTKG